MHVVSVVTASNDKVRVLFALEETVQTRISIHGSVRLEWGNSERLELDEHTWTDRLRADSESGRWKVPCRTQMFRDMS
jgi:hypothetical protein